MEIAVCGVLVRIEFVAHIVVEYRGVARKVVAHSDAAKKDVGDRTTLKMLRLEISHQLPFFVAIGLKKCARWRGKKCAQGQAWETCPIV